MALEETYSGDAVRILERIDRGDIQISAEESDQDTMLNSPYFRIELRDQTTMRFFLRALPPNELITLEHPSATTHPGDFGHRFAQILRDRERQDVSQELHLSNEIGGTVEDPDE